MKGRLNNEKKEPTLRHGKGGEDDGLRLEDVKTTGQIGLGLSEGESARNKR